MATVYLWNKQRVELTPDNWQDLAYQERQLRAAAFGRKLTPDESVSIIQAFRARALNQPVPDYAKGIEQAMDSVSYGREAEKLYIEKPAAAAEMGVRAAASAPLIIGALARTYAPAAFGTAVNVATIGGIALGLFVLWKVFK